MARDQVVKLFRDSRLNTSLRQTLNDSHSVEEFVGKAREYGYDFTVEEWMNSMQFQVEEFECQLSEIPGI